MAWGTVTCATACQGHRHSTQEGPRPSLSPGQGGIAGTHGEKELTAGVRCVPCAGASKCAGHKDFFFFWEPQTIWVYSSFPAAALCSPSRDVAVLDRLSFPGSGRWIYSQPIIRWLWLGRCFPALPPSHVQGVTDTPGPGLSCPGACLEKPGLTQASCLIARRTFHGREHRAGSACCQEGVEAPGGCAGSLQHPGMPSTPGRETG